MENHKWFGEKCEVSSVDKHKQNDSAFQRKGTNRMLVRFYN